MLSFVIAFCLSQGNAPVKSLESFDDFESRAVKMMLTYADKLGPDKTWHQLQKIVKEDPGNTYSAALGSIRLAILDYQLEYNIQPYIKVDTVKTVESHLRYLKQKFPGYKMELAALEATYFHYHGFDWDKTMKGRFYKKGQMRYMNGRPIGIATVDDTVFDSPPPNLVRSNNLVKQVRASSNKSLIVRCVQWQTEVGKLDYSQPLKAEFLVSKGYHEIMGLGLITSLIKQFQSFYLDKKGVNGSPPPRNPSVEARKNFYYDKYNAIVKRSPTSYLVLRARERETNKRVPGW
jgi:hypothetical protein